MRANKILNIVQRSALLVLAVVVAFQTVTPASAAKNDELFRINNDILIYDPNASGCNASFTQSNISLTIEQRIAATMIAGFDASDPDGLSASVKKFQLGGVYINGQPSASMNKDYFASINNGLPAQLLVAADDEGGQVVRFQKNAFTFSLPSAKTMGSWDDATITSQATTLASYLKSSGVNMVLAPVLDLDSNNTNNAISRYDRAFSSNPDTVTQKAGAFARAMGDSGLGTTLKHFPGIAKTTQNTDTTYQKINGDINSLSQDIKPFRSLLGTKNSSLMLSNAVVSGWGDDPVSLNPAAVQYLRESMGYEGIITTDDIGVFSKYSSNPIAIKEAIMRAYKAGVTMPLFAYPGDEAMDAIIKDIKLNVAQSTIDQAYTLATSYKTSLGLTVASQTAVPTATGNNKDYRGRKILSDLQLATIRANQPIYQKSGARFDIPWEMIAVIHLRESGLSRSNPGNGQGIYQFVDKHGGPYPAGPVPDDEFQRQTDLAADFIKGKASRPELLKQNDAAEIKDTFFGYNGRAPKYVLQATQLGFSDGYEGSPYVMNVADAKRDPEINTTSWGQIKSDGGEISYPANKDYGAFIIYAALANASLSPNDAGCNGRTSGSAGANGWTLSGDNAMTVYYQCGTPWGNMSYGIGTICECACGPTSTAMAIASLKKNPAITPKVMADFFSSHGGQIGGGHCGSTWGLFNSSSALASQYGVQFDNLGTDVSKFPDAIRRGSFILMSQGQGIFTSGGHFLLIRGTTADGNYLVADPASRQRTENAAGYTSAQILGNGQPDPSRQRGYLVNSWEVRLR